QWLQANCNLGIRRFMKPKVTGCKQPLRPHVPLLQPKAQLRSQGSLLNLKRILVPLDFSSTSLRTLRSVIPFAHKFASTIVLLHVVERVDMFGSHNSGQGTPEAALVSKAKEQLGMVLESEIGGVVSAETHVRIGRPFLEIVAFARLHDIDLL